MLDAKSVAFSTSASGVYFANTLFPQLGIADPMKGKSTSIAGPVGPVVARGEAEVALAQISELLPVRRIDYVGPLPSEIQLVTVFSGAIAVSAKEPEVAKALLRFLASPAAAPAIVKSALEPMTQR
jgi:molybdate transport system substrate-binding protein